MVASAAPSTRRVRGGVLHEHAGNHQHLQLYRDRDPPTSLLSQAPWRVKGKIINMRDCPSQSVSFRLSSMEGGRVGHPVGALTGACGGWSVA